MIAFGWCGKDAGAVVFAAIGVRERCLRAVAVVFTAIGARERWLGAVAVVFTLILSTFHTPTPTEPRG